MRYLVDTNVLLRYANRADRDHVVVRKAVRKLRSQGHSLETTSQNFTEFWNVATRPIINNGLGLDPTRADFLLRLAERAFALIADSPNIYKEWRRLVLGLAVIGSKVHDARLVAFMLGNAITHILTFNTADFTRYAVEGVTAVDPATV